jgi:hypothetical protein
VAAVTLTVVVVAVPFAAAVMVTGVMTETVPAVVEKVAVVVPAGMETAAGTVRAGLLPDRLMDKPLGAALLKVTVQVDVSLDLKVAGLQFNAVGTAGARSVSEEFTDAPFRLAVRVTVASAVTPEAVSVKVAFDAPAATLTEAGVLSEALLLDRVTKLAPAAVFKVTVQVEVPEPITDDGKQLSPLI